VLFETVDYLLAAKRFSGSGNFPTRDDGDSDRLVHWCHGATAFVFLFVRAAAAAAATAGGGGGGGASASAAAAAEKYRRAAVEAGEVVWARGLLCTKGPGLCHGIAGGGMVHLYLYHLTKVRPRAARRLPSSLRPESEGVPLSPVLRQDDKYLARAWRFAEQGLAHGATIYGKADHPFSLFNGIGGFVLFMQELAHVSVDRDHRPIFPGFDL
jgi:hypothetical protein